MTHARRIVGAGLAATLLVVASAVVTGCGKPTAGPEGGGEATVTQPGSLAAPGLYDLADGRVEAVGTLQRFEVEGGFWAVTDVPETAEPAPTGDTSGVIAVIPNAEDVRDDIESLRGAYVAVRGERLDGASVRMAGPEVVADTIELVEGDVTGE